MPNNIISNKPTIYQFGSHIQYLSVVSATSTAFAHSKPMFATNAFNFDCPHTMYITIIDIIIVTSAAVKRSMSTKKLLRKEPNLEFFFASSISFCPFFPFVFVLGHKIFQCFGGAEQFGVKVKSFYRNRQNLFLGCPMFQNRNA